MRDQRTEPAHAIALPALTPFVGPSVEAHGDCEAVDFLDRDFSGQTACLIVGGGRSVVLHDAD